MANLSADTVYKTKANAGARSYLVADAEVLYAGALVDVNAAGFLTKHADTAGNRFIGQLLEGVTGATSANPPAEGMVDESGVTLLGVTVASVTQADETAPVYCSTDNPADLVLTPTANAGPVGRVVRYISAGVADVELFTPAVAAAKSGLAGIYPLTFRVPLSTITAADVISAITIPHRFRIVSFAAHVETVVTTGGDAATLNLEIGTTDLTGGALALTSANCTPLGARVAASAITAGNVGNAGDTISVEASSVTAFAEGAVNLLIFIQNLDTLS